MTMPLLNNPDAWIAIGVSVLFLVAGVVMHRVVLKVLKNGAQEPLEHD